MPFKSEAQRRLFWAKVNQGEISRSTAKEWEAETPNKPLPQHVKQKEGSDPVEAFLLAKAAAEQKRKDYGPSGKWIYDRAHEIMKGTKDQYGKAQGESIAYAIATQQAHKVGKSPKGFRTAEGVATAKEKYQGPRSEYKKTAQAAATVVKPPEQPPQDGRVKLFLAGSIEMGRAEEWQKKVEDALSPYPVIIMDPRRDDWDNSWTQRASDPRFLEQVTWELDNLDNADVIGIYFDPTTASPISLLELGLHAQDPNVVVCCPPEFYRRGNVEIVCARYGIPLVDTLDEFIQRLIESLPKQGGNEIDQTKTAMRRSFFDELIQIRTVMR